MENQCLKNQVAALQKLVEEERENVRHEPTRKLRENTNEISGLTRDVYHSNRSLNANTPPISDDEQRPDVQKWNTIQGDEEKQFLLSKLTPDPAP